MSVHKRLPVGLTSLARHHFGGATAGAVHLLELTQPDAVSLHGLGSL